ncbi:Tenascin-X [Trichinella sp. T9]|nr:Tenascin-X [Trichinella sp. T9]
MLCLIVFTASLHSLLLQLAAAYECSSNSDCGSQTLCYKNKCVPAMPVGGDCESDYDCNISENHYCVYGICMTYAYVTEDKPNYNQKCASHYDCSGQRVCKKYKCVAAYATQRTCSYPADCELEEKCMDGLCFKAYVPGDSNNNNKPSFPPPTPPIYVPQCKQHEQCPNSYLCKDGKCKYAVQVGNIRCSYDKQCGETGGCKYGYCYFYKHENENNNPACTKHTHCPGYELCLRKQCVPASTWGVHCDNFQSCPPGNICKNACNKHSDCSGQAMCASNKCVAAKPTGPNCDKDSECKDSEACIYGICMSPAEKPPSSSKSCTNHYDCEGQQVCHKQKCVPAYSTGISCKNNGGCIAQQVCRFGVCWAAYV